MFLPIVAAAGCDPCYGISSCEDGATFSYQMRVVDPLGNPVEGARLEIFPESGVGLTGGRIQGTSDENGLVRINADPTGAGELTVGYELTRSSGESYRVGGIVLQTTRAGNRLNYGNVRSNPYVAYILEVVLRGTGDTIPVASADFVRTGGIPISHDTIQIVRNSSGLLAFHAEADALGDLIGNIRVRPSQREGILISSERHIPSFVLRDTAHWVQMRVGPTLTYEGKVLLPSGTNLPAVGVKVSFQQTGGIPLVQDSIEMETNPAGLFPLQVRQVDPWEEGEVVGRLHILPPPPYLPIEVEELRFSTFDADTVRRLNEWRLMVDTLSTP